MLKELRGVAAVCLFCTGLLAQPSIPKPGWNLFSKAQDIELGKEAAAEIKRQKQIVTDPRLNDFVKRLGQRLIRTQYAGEYPYTFEVVNDPSINAFALPGGPTFINTGLLKAAENEDQVVGVMAHEIAHVALRHGTHQASRANLIQLPAAIAGGLLGSKGSTLGQLANLGIGLGANSVLLKFSRDAESEADNLGARMMAEGGYNPVEMARFFEKLEASGGSRGPQFLSDHPNPGNRMKAIEEIAQSLPQQKYDASSGLFQNAKKAAGAVPAPTGDRTRVSQSAVQGADVRPSGRMKIYQNQAYSIAYPDNWEVFGDATGVAATIAPRSGILQTDSGVTQVADGVMISYFQSRGDRADLERDTSDLIRELQRTNPSLEIGRRQKRHTSVDTEDALVTVLYSESPYRGETEHDTLVTVARPEGLFYALFIAPASLAHDFTTTFDQMLKSLNFR